MTAASPAPTDPSAIAAKFFENFAAGDAPAMAAIVGDNVQWWVQGKGYYPREDICANHAGLIQATSERNMRITSTISEGDRVAVELDAQMVFLDGRTFNNTMHLAITVKDGKFVAVREYMDTAAARDFFAPS